MTRWMGVAAFLGCAGLIVAVLLREDLSVAANIAQLISILPVGVAAWLWLRRPRARVVTPARLADEVELLSSAVGIQWKAENALRSRHGSAMPIHWRVTTRHGVQAHPDTISKRPLFLLDAASHDLDSFVEDFRALSARRLVLLGGPGTGKTTLAVRFLLKLLAARTSGEPVPVLVPVAGWNADQDLREWFIARLSQDYPALASAKALVDGGHVLPVLDGLDELPQPAQAAMLTQLNQSFGTDPLILTCRTHEFAAAVETARQVVNRALVLEPEPLDGDEIADYLEHCMPPQPHPGWDGVLRSLRTEDSPLRTVTDTALGLWLICEIYLQPRTGADGSPLPFPDPAPLISQDRHASADELIDSLLDQFVPAVIASRPPAATGTEPFRPLRRRDPALTERWLGYLANLMGESRDLAWWRLARDTHAVSSRRFVLPPLLLSLAAVATVALTWWQSPASKLVGGLGTATLFVLFGKWASTAMATWPDEAPALAGFSLRRGQARVRHGGRPAPTTMPAMAVTIVAGGTYVVVLTWFYTSTASLLFLTVPVLLVVVSGGTLAFLISEQMAVPARTDATNTPLRSWQADRSLQAFRFSAGFLCLSAGPALPVLLLDLSPAVLLVCLAGAWLVVFAGGHHAWFAYVIAVRRLSRQGLVPRDLMYFLDDCHRLGLLRAVGPVYQFRHAALQDHLAR